MTTSSRLNQKMKSYDLIVIMISLFSLVTGNHIVSLSDHCTDRRYVNSLNTSFMQFTKEIVNEEYAVETEFKGLHCCAKGYRSIEWWVLQTCTAIIFLFTSISSEIVTNFVAFVENFYGSDALWHFVLWENCKTPNWNNLIHFNPLLHAQNVARIKFQTIKKIQTQHLYSEFSN